MGKSTISRGIFNSKLLVYQRYTPFSVRVFAARQLYVIPVHLFPSGARHGCSDGMEDHVGNSCWFHTFKWATFMAFMANKHLEKDDWQGKKLGYPLFGQSLCSVLAAYLCCICRSRRHAIRRSTRGGAKVPSQRKHHRHDVTFSMMLSRGDYRQIAFFQLFSGEFVIIGRPHLAHLEV